MQALNLLEKVDFFDIDNLIKIIGKAQEYARSEADEIAMALAIDTSAEKVTEYISDNLKKINEMGKMLEDEYSTFTRHWFSDNGYTVEKKK